MVNQWVFIFLVHLLQDFLVIPFIRIFVTFLKVKALINNSNNAKLNVIWVKTILSRTLDKYVGAIMFGYNVKVKTISRRSLKIRKSVMITT